MQVIILVREAISLISESAFEKSFLPFLASNRQYDLQVITGGATEGE